jgi:DNA modification methylase
MATKPQINTLEDKTMLSVPSVIRDLFPPSCELIPQINQIYELELAYGEAKLLSPPEIIQRGAYFRAVEGQVTHHFQICVATPNQVNASARQERKNFFAANVFAVGYGTHGLFPYRGKFHPQMIKAIMNVIGLRPGDAVLDPMAGCGTTMIEASIMGIDSIGVELSPFACLMNQAKLNGLALRSDRFDELLQEHEEVLALFNKKREPVQEGLFRCKKSIRKILEDTPGLKEVLELCYLDTMGYARRRKHKGIRDLFPDLLVRYLEAIRAFDHVRERLGLKLGRAQVLCADARCLELEDQSVHGVLFSPPYSFAVDYVENDRPQLEYLGVNPEELKEQMVGLRPLQPKGGDRIQDMVQQYFEDMERILGECHRVLKPKAYCVVVVGSNTWQTKGIQLEVSLIEAAERVGFRLRHQIVREIEGIRNTLREEYLLFFQK